MSRPEDSKEVLLFFKYAIFIPIFLTIFLELLQYLKIININWFWVFSPLWIWFLGAIQFLFGGMLTEIMINKKDKK